MHNINKFFYYYKQPTPEKSGKKIKKFFKKVLDF